MIKCYRPSASHPSKRIRRGNERRERWGGRGRGEEREREQLIRMIRGNRWRKGDDRGSRGICTYLYGGCWLCHPYLHTYTLPNLSTLTPIRRRDNAHCFEHPTHPWFKTRYLGAFLECLRRDTIRLNGI